jgi:hypothetical protein
MEVCRACGHLRSRPLLRLTGQRLIAQEFEGIPLGDPDGMDFELASSKVGTGMIR